MTRAEKIKKRLFEVEYVTKKEWWGMNETILTNDAIKKEPLVVRKALGIEYVMRNMPAEIKPDELIVGIATMAATGLGYEFPDYALPEEKEEALRSCYTFKSVWGHHPGDYEKLLRVGVKGLREEIYAKLREEAAKPGCDAGKIDYYRAMLISINSLNDLSYRYAQLTLDEAAKTVDSVRRQELLTISEICNRVPENPASSLHEALQSVFFMMCALQSTLEIVPLGRVDQYLYPYYKHDLETGVLTKEQAEELKTSAAATDEERRRAERRFKDAEEAVTRNDNIKAGLKLKLDSRRRQQAEAADNLQKADRERSAAAQRIHILEDLERNMDGYQQSVKAVMRAAGGGRLRGIIGPVAGIITVEKGYETAIETALGFALQNIVVEDQGCARAAIGFLKDERAGRATFLPLDTVQGSRFTGRLTGTAEVAADLVRTDPKYQHIIDNLLGRIIVVEDLTEASAVARNLGYRNRIVTLDGQVINAGGSFTGGSTARSVGVFSRKQELDELRSKLTKLEQKRTEAEKELAARKAEVDNLSAQLAGAEGEGMNAATEHVRANLELERLTKAAAQYDETARSIEAEIAAQQAAVTRNETARTEAEKARTDAEAELAQYTAELAALGESTGSLTAEREKITGELSEKQLQRLADEKDVGLHEAALEGLRSRTGEADARARELQTAIEAAKAKIEANALKIAEMERVRGDNQQKIAAAEETIRSANAARLEKEAAISKLGQDNRALTDERERMSGEMARLAERRTAAETELNDTNSKLWEEYQLTESEARSQCVPFESLTELRRSVTEVRGKIRALGNVNVGAIDEYKEVRERYDFMKAQVTDVEKAKAELTKMIAELCSEMQELFTASFKQINANFQQIFKELFGGGHARLYLSDEANVLESGIEIEVSPPGKVIKNLSALSGGEQALVAISIYFAILRVNPAPFCFLDEIEAALDDVNVARYAQYLRRMTDRTQFIVITHRRGTMEAADVLYGVTMQEDGVSKILRLDLDNVSADLIT